jgi:hypothetical protein
MKYVAVCVLSVVTMLSASASPSATQLAASQVAPTAQLFPTSLIAPAVVAGEDARGNSLLMAMLGGALIALQLRRRQKSLRSPRLAILSS